MEESTYLAAGLVFMETLWRYSQCSSFITQSLYTVSFSPKILIDSNPDIFLPSFWYSIAFVLCILAIFLNIKKYEFTKKPLFRNTLSFMHGMDSINALILGYAMYYENNFILSIGTFIMSKLFLLHLLSRMVTGEASFTNFQVCVQTTKTFLHHFGSFMFLSISHPKVIFVTTLWRFISMNGHAALTLRDKLSHNILDKVLWKIAHARNITIITIFYLCITDDEIQRGFAISAVGHVAYMAVRLGPVFRLGSIYVEEGPVKEKWQQSGDFTKLKAVLLFKYPFLSVELLLLFALTVYFLYLRLFSNVHILDNQCSFH